MSIHLREFSLREIYSYIAKLLGRRFRKSGDIRACKAHMHAAVHLIPF